MTFIIRCAAVLLSVGVAIAAEPALRFDFGPAENAPAEGFTRVSCKDTYTAEKGFGWDKRWGFDFAREGAPVVRDGICAHDHIRKDERDATFRVNAPKGVYQVTVWLGDAGKSEGRQGLCVATNGRVVLPPPGVGGWGTVTERTVPAVVDNGLLEVKFFVVGESASHRLSVLALKAERVTDAEQEKALRRKWAEDAPPEETKPREVVVNGKTLKEIGHRNEIALGPLPAALKDKPFLFFTRRNPGDILSYSIPRQEELCDAVAAFATPDDDQPLFLGIHALRDLKDVRLHCSDFVAPNGRIARSEVEILTQTTRPRATSDKPGNSARIVADLLEKATPFALASGASQGVFLRVHVPAGQPEGIYEAALTVSPLDEARDSLKLRLRVLPLKLSRPEGKVWHLFADSARWYGMVRRQVLNEVTDMARHGINSLSIGYPPIEGVYVERDARIQDVDLTRTGEALRHAAAEGMNGPVMVAATPGIASRLRGWSIGHKGGASHAYAAGEQGRALEIRHAAKEDSTGLGAVAGSLMTPGLPLRFELRYRLDGLSASADLTFMKSYKRDPVEENRISMRLEPTGGQWRTAAGFTRVPAEALYGRVDVRISGGPGVLAIDEVRVLGPDGLLNYVINPGFERDIEMPNLNQPQWPDDFAREYSDACRALARGVEHCGLKAYIEGTDEAGNNPKDADKETNELRYARPAGAPIWCNVSPSFAEKAGNLLDAVCHYSSFLGDEKSCAALAARYHGQGKQFYFISSGCYVGQEFDMMPNRHGVGAAFWKSGLDGTGIWTFQRPNGDPFNDFDGVFKEYCLVFPPREKGGEPVPTLGWEGIREGWKDYRYFDALDRAVARAEKDGRRDAAAMGRGVLDFLRASVPWFDRAQDAGVDNRAADEMRWLAAWAAMRVDSPAPAASATAPADRKGRVQFEFAPAKRAAPLCPLVCPPVAKAPAFDGTLNDPAWQTAARIDGLDNYQQPGVPARQKTEVLLCHDAEALYVGFRCLEPAMDQLKASVKERDGGVFGDDSVEIFLDSANDEFNFLQLAFNAAGTQFDMRCAGDNYAGANVFGVDYDRKKVRDAAWNGDWAVKTSRHADRWEAEVRLPFKTVGRASDLWGMNFCRNRRAGEAETSSWQAIGSFHQPAQFGKVLLGGARRGEARITRLEVDPLRFGEGSAVAQLKGGDRLKAFSSTTRRGPSATESAVETTAGGAAHFRFSLDESATGVRLVLSDAQGGEAFGIALPARVAPPLQVRSGRKVLLGDAAGGRLSLALNLSDSERARRTLVCRLLGADGREIDSARTPITGETCDVRFNTTGFTDGRYDVELALETPAGGPAIQRKESLIVIPDLFSAAVPSRP